MSETDYNARLYEKMKAEQDKYRDWLLQSGAVRNPQPHLRIVSSKSTSKNMLPYILVTPQYGER